MIIRLYPREWKAPYLMLLALVCGGMTLLAQPRISYLIPDIGTTRFATYVEIIGPHDATGNFGADGAYLNNPGDAVQVRCQRAADTALVKIGPCIVSWNGRMISTLFFVVPTAQPNSDDWRALQPQFRIPVEVVVNGQVSVADTFYVVRQATLGDKRASADRMLGEGSLGRRSRRGAMIIDSLVLAGADYTVSVADCDPISPGNQGYLPFTLLSKGRVLAQNTAKILASGNNSDGGPGGGGGGGAYVNSIFGGSGGTIGGRGFTGGGPGGENGSVSGSSRRKPGTGSGDDPNSGTVGGRALNGQPGGDATSAFENSGGGTGHPFGRSGVGCDQKDNCTPAGGFGGGSGGREGQAGASAGYEEPGIPSGSQPNAGQVYGNAMIIPLAGGSGGASGNPTGVTGQSSAGGGGGGAVAIHALVTANFDVDVRGSYASFTDVAGGGGSGGAIVIGARLDNSTVGGVGGQTGTPDHNRHLKGGKGRSRYDQWIRDPGQFYIGILSDTTTVSLREVNIIGNSNGSDIFVYLKPERGPWQVIDTISGYSAPGRGGTWRFQNRLPGSDTLYFIAFGQRVANPTQAPFTAEPSVVLSQSAWNIVRLKGPPVIQTADERDLGVYRCPNEVVLDTITVSNLGESPLEVSTATFTGAAGFSLVQPTVFPDSIQSNTSKQYIVAYVAQVGQSGPQVGQLILDNTDTVKARDPWIVDYAVDVRLVDLQYKFRGGVYDTIDIGALCVNTPLFDQIVVENSAQDPVSLLNYTSGDAALVEVSANLPFTIPVGGFRNLNFRIIAKRVGQATVPTLLWIQGCQEPDTVWIRYEGVAPRLSLVGTGQFGVVPVGGSGQVVMQLRNDGSSDLDIQNLPTVAAPFRLVSATPAPPFVLPPGGTIELVFEYTPSAVGSNQATFWIRSQNTTGMAGRSCADSVEVILAGLARTSEVVAVPGSLTYAPTRSCDATTELVTIRNTGGTAVTLLRPAFVNGVNSADFVVTSEPLSDTLIPSGGEALYEVTFSPAIGGTSLRTALLSVRTTAPGLPQVNVPLNGPVATIDLQGPRYLDLGLVTVGAPTVVQATYINNTPADVTITQIRSSRPIVLSATPASFTVAMGAQQTIDVTVTATSEATALDTLWFVSSDPCPDSFPVLVRWTSESGSLGITNNLSFGTLSNCAVAVDTIIISNTSKVPVDLIDVSVVGPDAALFTILDPSLVTNVTLQPSARVALLVEFDPRGSTDGVKTATVTVRARIGNQPTAFSCAVSGTRATSIPSTPGPVSFGLVDVQQSSNQTLTIVNTGVLPVRITALRMRGTAGGVFTAASGPIPTTLQPGDRLDVVITFLPVDRVTYVDSLLIDFDQPCSDVKAVALSGTGRLNVEVAVRLPFMVVSPAEDNLVIPVKAQIVAGAVTSIVADARFIVRSNTSMFVIQRVSSGRIVRNQSLAGVTELEVELAGATITDQESTILELYGQATLGSQDSTVLDLAFAELSASGSTYTSRPEDGWLRLEICEEGGPRLVQRTGALNLRQYPSPASDALTVEVQVFERGIHSLELVDVHGNVVRTDEWYHEQGGGVRTTSFDVRALASGPYSVRLITPTRQRQTPALIIH